MKVNEVKITKTQLRALIFWASSGIERSNGGSYRSIINFIKDHHKLMWDDCHDYRSISFGKRLKK